MRLTRRAKTVLNVYPYCPSVYANAMAVFFIGWEVQYWISAQLIRTSHPHIMD
jgi:hypothetical protein